MFRFIPAENDDELPRMDIIADDLGGYCYCSWETRKSIFTYAEVHLTPDSECTMPRTIIHEARTSRIVVAHQLTLEFSIDRARTVRVPHDDSL